MTESTHTVCSTSNCDNRATVKVADTSEPMLVCGSCWHAMMMVETVTTMSEADRAAARKLVKDWCDPRPPKGWEMREPGYFVRAGEEHGSWIDARDRYFRIGWRAEQMHVPVEIVDVALRSIIAGMAPALAGMLTNALDDGDALRGVIARAIEASNSIADRDAEDAIQEMLQHLLEAEPEGHDDRIEWARMEGANAMLELIVQAGYGTRGIADNRDALRKRVAELAVSATLPRNPEPEFEAALMQREVEQLRAQLEEQQAAAHARAERQAEECQAKVDEAEREGDLLREQLDLVLRRLGWDGEATNECPYEDADAVARALLEDRDADARAQHAEVTRQRDMLAAGLQAMAEAHYDAWSEDWPAWVVVPMDDGLGLWINEGEERTILEMHHKDYAAMGATAADEAGRIVTAVNNSMKLAEQLAEIAAMVIE